jgi:hypothetical protein
MLASDAYFFGMKHLLLICFFSLFAKLSSAEVVHHVVAPADTITGHTHLVRKLSQELCSKLTNDHTTAFDKLTPPQAMQLTQQLFTDAMQHDSVAVIRMMQEAAKQQLQPQQVGQLLGKDVVLSLSRSCPASLPLLARLSLTDQAQQAAAAQQPTLSDAEKKAIQPLAAHLCTQLAAADAKQPLAKQTPAERFALSTSLIQKELTTGRPQLLRYYSAAQLADKPRMQEISEKIISLMLTQKSCGQYVMQLGADELAKQKP